MEYNRRILLQQTVAFSILFAILLPIAFTSNQIINGDFQSHEPFDQLCSLDMCYGFEQFYKFVSVKSGNQFWFTKSDNTYKIRSKNLGGVTTSVFDPFFQGQKQQICQIIQVKKGYRYNFSFDAIVSNHYSSGFFQVSIDGQQNTYKTSISKKFYQTFESQDTNLTALLCLKGKTDPENDQNGPLFDNIVFEQIESFCEAHKCAICVDQQQNKCKICQIGFYIVNFECYSCSSAINNCIKCTNSTFCTQCVAEYTFFSANKTCILKNQSCFANISNCKQCQSISSCLKCVDSYIISQDKKFCNQPQVQQCKNCINCLNQFECLQCKPQYILNEFKTCVLPTAFQIELIYQSTGINNLVIIQTNLTKAWIQKAQILQNQFLQVFINFQNQTLMNVGFNQTEHLNAAFYLGFGCLPNSNISIKIVNHTIQSNYYLYFHETQMISIQKYSDAGIDCMNAIQLLTADGLYKALAPTVKWLKYFTFGSLINPVFNNLNMASFYGYSFYRVKMPKNIKISLQDIFERFKIHGIFEIMNIKPEFMNSSYKNTQKIKPSPFPWKGKLDFEFTSQIIKNNAEILFLMSLFFIRIILFSVLQKILKWRVVDINYKKFEMVSMEYQSFTPYFLISVGSYIATQISAIHFVEKFKILSQIIFLALSLLIPFFQYVNSYMNSQLIFSNKKKIILKISKKKSLNKEVPLGKEKQINIQIRKQLKKTHLEELLCLTQNISLFAIPFCIAIENKIALAVVGTLTMILRLAVTLASLKLFSRPRLVYLLSMSIIWTIYHSIFVTFYIMQTTGSYQAGDPEQLFQTLGFVGIIILPLIGILPTIQVIVNIVLQTKIVISQYLEQFKQKNRIDPNNDIKDVNEKKNPTESEDKGIFNFDGMQKHNQTGNDDSIYGKNNETPFKVPKKKKVNFSKTQSLQPEDFTIPQLLQVDSTVKSESINCQSILKIKNSKGEKLKRIPHLTITYHEF